MNIFELNPNDFVGMCELMDKYGDESYPFCGTDEYGNNVLISVNPDNITVNTFQENGWVRTNIYNRYGDNEELYEKC